MTSRETADFGAGKGYDDWMHFYLAGRCGVLGDVDPSVVIAGFGFMAPRAVHALWPSVLEIAPARRAAAYYTEACESYGRTTLAEMAETDACRLGDLLEKVVDTADVSGLPLFAGWKAMPRPTDVRGRAMFLIHVLREWRGGIHVACITAADLTPLEAIMLNGGPDYARLFGWPQPWGDGNGKQQQLDDAEQATTARCAEVLDLTLTEAQQEELIDLLTRAAYLMSPRSA
ncbi:MAG: hypothetical protein GEV10_25435 [Streptosporangiales bacterium]|nr:hypothetical protein [Streptosporangiales bacterium]